MATYESPLPKPVFPPTDVGTEEMRAWMLHHRPFARKFNAADREVYQSVKSALTSRDTWARKRGDRKFRRHHNRVTQENRPALGTPAADKQRAANTAAKKLSRAKSAGRFNILHFKYCIMNDNKKVIGNYFLRVKLHQIDQIKNYKVLKFN